MCSRLLSGNWIATSVEIYGYGHVDNYTKMVFCHFFGKFRTSRRMEC